MNHPNDNTNASQTVPNTPPASILIGIDWAENEHQFYQYRPSGSKRYIETEHTAEEFMRRFLQHVLPRGLQKVRHYGFLHSGSRTDFELLCWIVTLSLNLIYVLTFKQP